jgi:Spy/CpxP family protein refolding chaperone
MKKLFSSLTVISALTCPVFAQELGDTTDSATAPTQTMDATDNLALIAPGIAAPEESIAVGVGSGAQAGLSLSDDQLEKIAKLRNEFSDAAGSKVVQLRSLMRQQKDLMTQEKVDKSQVLDIQNKINSIKTDLSNAKLNMRLDTLALLTPDQKQKIRHKALQREVFGAGGFKGKHGHHRRHCGPAPVGPAGGTPPAPPA